MTKVEELIAAIVAARKKLKAARVVADEARSREAEAIIELQRARNRMNDYVEIELQ